MVSRISLSCHSNYGETLAVRLVISLVFSLNIDRFILKCNSQVVILALQHLIISQDWHIDYVIFDTLNSITSYSIWKVRNVNKSANFCTHFMAN
jgi:hypothetical protein